MRLVDAAGSPSTLPAAASEKPARSPLVAGEDARRRVGAAGLADRLRSIVAVRAGSGSRSRRSRRRPRWRPGRRRRGVGAPIAMSGMPSAITSPTPATAGPAGALGDWGW